METKQIWVLVLGALAIALVTSVISANITADVVKVKLDSSKKAPQVYTTAEVDAKINNAFSSCFITSPHPGSNAENGKVACAYARSGSKCLFSEVTFSGYAKNLSLSEVGNLIDDGTVVGPKDFFMYSLMDSCESTGTKLYEEIGEENIKNRLKIINMDLTYFCCLGTLGKNNIPGKVASNESKPFFTGYGSTA